MKKPAVWVWLIKVANLEAFSIQSYIVNSLISWMRQQPGVELLSTTRFIASSLNHLDQSARETLRQKLPWQLADGHVLLPEDRGEKQLVTPECMEGDTGWNHLFPALDRHFFVIHDDYCSGLSAESFSELRNLFRVCGAKSFPDPRIRELNHGDIHYNEALVRCAQSVYGTPRLRDWAAPGWILGLSNVERIANGEWKVKALERWSKGVGLDHAKKLLHCEKPVYEETWQQINAWSEFGLTLHDKPWLRTTKGYVTPSAAFLDTPEFREFFSDSIPYVVADISVELLEELGVGIHLTAEVLIGRLRQLSGTENPDFALLEKIYRRLQDSVFDPEPFRQENLIFLSEPKPRWLSIEKLVWQDAGELFDNEFGYASLTYCKSELNRLFIEKLKVPNQPEIRQYAAAWRNLCSTALLEPVTINKKLKIIMQRLADSQAELLGSDWWPKFKPFLRIRTENGQFQPPPQVYVADNLTGAELFKRHILIAFPSKPKSVLDFLRWIGCRSLAENIIPKLAKISGESERWSPTFLTPAAKELCLFLVCCSQPGWKNHCSRLLALRNSEEVGVTGIIVEYTLHDNPNIGNQVREQDAYWDETNQRLLLRDGADPSRCGMRWRKGWPLHFMVRLRAPTSRRNFFNCLLCRRHELDN